MPPLSSTIHLYPPASTSTNSSSRTYLVYHITGNPGLIEYYRIFLTQLYALLNSSHSPCFSSSPSIHFQVYGRSLSGFEVSSKPNDVKSTPFSLEEQIVESERCLVELVERLEKEGKKDVRVILMGHSVGSYILLEIIRQLREKGDHVRIVGGVCLFPTVTHIAKSPSGRKATPLFVLPSFPLLIHLFAKTLTLLLPTSALSFLIQMFMSFPKEAADVTAAFVKSKHGVQQALHMAHDEMETITEDSWDHEIWGATHPTENPHERPVLRFLFAETDHWVADETRDELIRIRGTPNSEDESWRPKMEIDTEYGWPHGFCIKHSVPVAERVCGYIQDIVGRDMAVASKEARR